jgi:hypothetical protein
MSNNTKILGGVPIMGFISPNNTYDTYPVIEPLYGIDGIRNVDTLADLNEIPDERRRAGMLVGVFGGSVFFKLKDVEWNGTIDDWDEIELTLKKDVVKYIDKETPIGLINNTNTIFELSHIPIHGSEHIYLNGLLLESGSNSDYMIYGNAIMFNYPLIENMKLKCSYRTV